MINNASSIQIIGTQRSGSNLLRLILNQFEEISAPHPPHVLKTFVPLENYYGNLMDQANFMTLANDIADFVNANPVPWNSSRINARELAQRAKDNSLISLYESLYSIKAEDDGAKIWCCKSMFNEYYVDQLERKGILPLYIHLIRDGRDVAASFKKAFVGPKHVYHIAKKWKEDQLKAKQVQDYVGNDRFYILKYEDLLNKPKLELKKLASFLGLEYTPRLLQFHTSLESINTANSGMMWKNVASPILKNNHDKYKLLLSSKEILIFEQVAGDILYGLGYKLVTSTRSTEYNFSKEEIDEFNQQNTIEKQKVIASLPKVDLELRAPQQRVLENIKKRYGISQTEL